MFIALLRIANNVSKIGTANTNTGTIIATKVALLNGLIIESEASIKPKNSEPPSPIKILAGLKLYGKNPAAPPATASIAIVTP